MPAGDLFAQSYAAEPSASWQPVSPMLPRPLFAYQEAGLEGFTMRRHMLCALHPGAGKTPMALAAPITLTHSRVFIVVPPALVGQWYDRAHSWGYPYPAIQRLTTNEAARLFVPISQVTIIADSLLGSLRLHECDLLIVDECHRFKVSVANADKAPSKRALALLGRDGLVARAGKVLAMSGTPAPNGPVELYPWLARLAPHIAPTWAAFTSRFCPPYERAMGAVRIKMFDRAINVQELNRELRSSILFRPPREAVLAHLPLRRDDSFSVPALVSTIPVDVATAAFIDGGEAADAPAISESRVRLGLEKARLALPFLQTLVDGHDRPLIWCWHREVAEFVASALSVPVIHGGMPKEDRAAPAAEFVAGRHAALVATIAASGTGLDGLQYGTDLAVFLEQSFVPGENEQAEARLWRTGTPAPVRFLTVTSPDNLDIAMARALRAKARVLQELTQ